MKSSMGISLGVIAKLAPLLSRLDSSWVNCLSDKFLTQLDLWM